MKSYIIEASWKGADYVLRRKLVIVAATHNGEGSGFDFVTGRYDITWSFQQRPAAERLLKRLRDAAPRRVRVRLIDASEPDRPPRGTTEARRRGRARLAAARKRKARLISD